jgi:AraC-like DNA-binding protein
VILGESYIRAISLFGLEEICEEYNGNLLALMQEVGIPASALRNFDDLISFRAFVTLVETISIRLNIPNLGILAAEQRAPDYTNLGPSVMMARFVKTLGEWMENTQRYWRFHTNGFAMQLILPEGSDRAILRLHYDGLTPPGRQFTEGTVANIIGVTRVVGNQPQQTAHVIRFQHRRPTNTIAHANFFRCPIEFGCDHVEIEFARHVLDYPTSGSLQVFQPLMRLYIGERIRRMHLFDHSASATVALAITTMLGSGNCSLETAADSLGVNVKNLQRQLAKENTTFSTLLEHVRENMARHLLVETDAPVAHIAGLLDYSTTAPFTSAFERWTGTTPLKFRQRERAKRVNAAPGQSMSVED